MENYLAYVTYILLIALTYLSTIYIWGRLRKLPPSPFHCLPIIGHLYLQKHPRTETFMRLAKEYGAILFLWSGLRPYIVVSSPAAAEECLNKNDIVFCNRRTESLIGKYRGYNFTSLNFAPYSPHWVNLRKIIMVEMLSANRLQAQASIRVDEVRLLIKRLLGSSRVGEIRNPIFDTNLNVMTRMLLGKRYFGLEAHSETAKRIREFVVESIELANVRYIGDIVPYLKFLNRKAENRFIKYTEHRDELMTDLLEEHRVKRMEIKSKNNEADANGDDTALKPMIQRLLDIQESDPKYYHDRLLQSLIGDLLVGSSETSTGTMEWALSLLLNNPRVMKKLRAEIDSHVGYERLLEEPDLNNIAYLRCIINETLRMHPPIPRLFPHESSEECILGGYRIPSKTVLSVNIHTIQNDPDLWDSPKTFKPERFEGVEGNRIGYKMMPFGSGRRSCPGEGLAVRVMGMMLGSLIQCFDLERVSDDELVDMAELSSFKLQKAEPLYVKIQPRQVMVNLLGKL